MKTAIRKITNVSLVFFMSASYAANAMETGEEVSSFADSSHQALLEKNRNYSEKRLQELEVIYTSALDEIQWVLGNYPLAGKKTERVTVEGDRAKRGVDAASLIGGGPASVAVNTDVTPKIKSKNLSVGGGEDAAVAMLPRRVTSEKFEEEEAKVSSDAHALALTWKQHGKSIVDYEIRQLPLGEQEEKKRDDQYKAKQYMRYLFPYYWKSSTVGEIDEEGMQLAIHKVEVFLREKKDYPTKSEILAMLALPDLLLDNPEIAQLAQRYDMADYQMGQLKGYGSSNPPRFHIPVAGEMQEWVRLRDDLNVWPNLEQINEGLRQKRDLEIPFPSIEQINEGLRLAKIGINKPSEDQINEGLRLIKIGIARPSKDQIDAGLYIRREGTPEEIERLVSEKIKPAKEIADKAVTVWRLYGRDSFSQGKPSYEPYVSDEYRQRLRVLAMALIEDFPNLDERLLQKAELLNIKDPVLIKELMRLRKLGIKEPHINIIRTIHEGLRQNKFRHQDQPANAEQIYEGLRQDFYEREEPSLTYVAQVDEGVRQKYFYGSPSPWTPSIEQINEGLRQNKERGRETDAEEIEAGLDLEDKKAGSKATPEEIDAYLYLKELEKNGDKFIGYYTGFHKRKKYIPAVIRLQQVKPKNEFGRPHEPTLDEIEEEVTKKEKQGD